MQNETVKVERGIIASSSGWLKVYNYCFNSLRFI